MMTMIERVARAMVAADSGLEGSALFDIHWQEFGEGYTESARVAIEAMRDPTKRMLQLADGYTDLSGYDPSCDAEWRHKEFKIAWQVMIDEALGRSIDGD